MDRNQEWDLYSFHSLEFLGRTGIWESLLLHEKKWWWGLSISICPISLLCLIIINCGGGRCEFLSNFREFPLLSLYCLLFFLLQQKFRDLSSRVFLLFFFSIWVLVKAKLYPVGSKLWD